MQATVLGLILAGGRSTRMGQDKALVRLQGKPLLQHALDRLSPQVGQVAINANGDPARFATFGVAVIPDLMDLTDQGPLGGVLAGLNHARRLGLSHIATLPCDAPFAPVDLVARLMSSSGSGQVGGEHVVMACGPNGLEPAFALWPVLGLAALAACAKRGVRSLRGAAAELGPIIGVSFIPAGADEEMFINLNRPEDLAATEARLSG